MLQKHTWAWTSTGNSGGFSREVISKQSVKEEQESISKGMWRVEIEGRILFQREERACWKSNGKSLLDAFRVLKISVGLHCRVTWEEAWKQSDGGSQRWRYRMLILSHRKQISIRHFKLRSQLSASCTLVPGHTSPAPMDTNPLEPASQVCAGLGLSDQ